MQHLLKIDFIILLFIKTVNCATFIKNRFKINFYWGKIQ
jgi:hypothetical protein